MTKIKIYDGPKKGCNFKPLTFDKFQLRTGTENKWELKSAWMVFSGIVISDFEDRMKNKGYFLTRFRRAVKQAAIHYGLKSDIIFDSVFPNSYPDEGRCFYNLNVNVFTEEHMHYKEMSNLLNKIAIHVNKVFEEEENLIFLKYLKEFQKMKHA